MWGRGRYLKLVAWLLFLLPAAARRARAALGAAFACAPLVRENVMPTGIEKNNTGEEFNTLSCHAGRAPLWPRFQLGFGSPRTPDGSVGCVSEHGSFNLACVL